MSSSGASNELKLSKIKVPHELKPITIQHLDQIECNSQVSIGSKYLDE
jgi:hypothetical protein